MEGPQISQKAQMRNSENICVYMRNRRSQQVHALRASGARVCRHSAAIAFGVIHRGDDDLLAHPPTPLFPSATSVVSLVPRLTTGYKL
jgi:hypothetical protein